MSPFRYWPRLEDGQESPGPNEKQKLLWIDRMPRDDRPHQCDVDGVLCLGGTRSGKTVGVVARCASILTAFPGSQIIVGSTTFTHLEDTLILDWQELFSDKQPWDHPSVKVYPNRQHKYLLISNGHGKRDSIVRFAGFDQKEGDNTLGQQCNAWHIDEPQNLNHGINVLSTLVTRLSNNASPFRQYFLTGNPTKNLGWVKKEWNLKQFEDGYKGPPMPIGKPCTCHMCVKCKLPKNGKRLIPYIDGTCPNCGYVKKTSCPGNQYSRRVIFSSAQDNVDYLPEIYQGMLEQHLDDDAAKKLGEGKIIKDTGGLCYPKFGDWNQAENDRSIDLDQDMTWFLDLNQRPQASAIYQKRLADKYTFIDVKDEFALWDKDVIHVANAFVERYGDLDFDGWVNVFGDPMMNSGHFVRYKELVTKNKFEVIKKILKENGFKVRILTPATRYAIKDRIECVNHNCRDSEGIARISINPSCKWMIASLEQTKWANGEKEESKDIDHKCMKTGKEGEVWGTTHHAAALGYALLKDSPMVKIAGKRPFFIGRDGTAVILNEDGQLEQKDYSKPEDFETQEAEDEYYNKDPEPSPIILRPPQLSLADEWRKRGLINLRRPI